MAILTKNEKYIVEMYVRYFGKTPTKAQIDEYAEVGKPKEILKQIMGDANDAKPSNITYDDYIDSIFQNLFGRPASGPEKTKYAKTYDKKGVLPINSIVKSAKKSDKDVYQTKKLVALLIAEEGSTTDFDLDKITKNTYEKIYNPKTKKLSVDVAELKTKIDAMPDNVTGKTFNLTTSIDTLVGTDKGDVFNGIVDTNSTLTALDSIDGGLGNDTLNILATTALTLPSGLEVKNVETANLKAGITIVADTTTWTGLTTANVTKATTASVTAATTTDVNVSGATDDITVKGGNDITITDNTAASSIKVEDTNSNTTGNYATGKITITDTNFGVAETIAVDGGSDVTITATADKVNVGTITVGGNKAATGDVKVVSNTTSNGTATTAGSVNVTGGKTVEITANMTNTAVKGGGTGVITAGTYTVTADNTTTNVTITQNATAIDFENDAAAMVKETSVVTFNNMKANETLIINGLTFTASKDLTATEVAAAFANLTAADTQSATGITANGIYSGTFNSAVWTSSAANGATVTFTAQDNDETDLAFTGTAATNDSAARIPTQVKTAGTAAGASTAVNVTEDFGNVVVNDNATASITTITLDGFDGATLGASGSLDKLATLNLTNSAGTTALTSTVATLNVTLNDMAGTVDLGDAAATTLKTLNLTTTGEASTIILDAAAVETLTIAAAADLDISNGGTNLGALKTATITGARDVNLGDLSASASFATLNASAAKGDITAEITATNTAVTTGSGNDTITATVGAVGTAISKAIDLGAGDDTLVLFDDTTAVPTAAVKGGDGVDTISMTSVSADAYDANENFKNAISGFERLVISNKFGTNDGNVDTLTIDLAKLGFTSYVTTSGTNVNGVSGATATDTLTLSQLAANATVVLTANGSITASLATATGNTDVINVIVDATNTTTTAGTFTVADVETVKITAKGEFLDDGVTGGTTANDGIDDTAADIASLSLVAAAAKTVTVDGYADLTLTTTAANLKTVDASAMTGDLTYTINSSVADFALTSGSGIDAITISTSNNAQVKTGAGADTITVQNGAVSANIWGGAGNDIFDVTDAISSATQYVTIEDATSGDQIKLDTSHFLSGSVSITDFDQMTLTDKFNAVLTDTGLNVDRGADDTFAISFQHAGNTYIVVSDGNGTSNFGGATGDQVIKLTGLKDLSAGASFNIDGTLEIA